MTEQEKPGAPDPMTAARRSRLATRCVLCDMPLADAASVEVGIGPKCRKRAGLTETVVGRAEANELTALAAIAAEDGDVRRVLEIADTLEPLFPVLAGKLRKKFVAIRVARVPEGLLVQTPFNDRFVQQMWERRLGRWDRDLKGRLVMLDRKAELWAVLKECFPGQQGIGPDGKVFEITGTHGVSVGSTAQIELPR